MFALCATDARKAKATTLRCTQKWLEGLYYKCRLAGGLPLDDVKYCADENEGAGARVDDSPQCNGNEESVDDGK